MKLEVHCHRNSAMSADKRMQQFFFTRSTDRQKLETREILQDSERLQASIPQVGLPSAPRPSGIGHLDAD